MQQLYAMNQDDQTLTCVLWGS